MKKAIFFILATLFLFINCLPSSIVFADDSGYTSSQYSNIGALMLANLIQSGEATEIDFSDYSENDGLDFLIALGELAVTGDPSGLVDQGLNWLGGELDQAYDDLIWSIREWEYSIAPNLYNYWYNGSDYEIKLEPVSNGAKPLVKLLSPPADNSPNIPTDLAPLVANIGGYAMGSWDFRNNQLYNNGWGNSNKIYVTGDFSIYSQDGQITSPTTAFTKSGYWKISNYGTVKLYSVGDGSYTADYLNFSIKYFEGTNLNMASNGLLGDFMYSVPVLQFRTLTNNNSAIVGTTTFSSITIAINYLNTHFRHINLYVDDILWSGELPTYPIVIPNGMTVLNDQPAQYIYSEPTHIDLSGLTTLITNAINQSDILTWQDIDDYFLDINGVQALPTINIIRNDYDNMYIEQYPYPAKLIGMQDPLKFNEHMLDNYYGQYLTPMVDVASNTIDILPGEIKWVLGIGAILMIFAVIINRLLE